MSSLSKKKELLLILGLLLAAGLLWCSLKIFSSGSAPTIRITVDGEEFGIYSLAQNQVISIGDTNVCEIKNGMVQMTSATCPDKLCIHQGAIGEKGGVIVCLPNRVVIESGSSTYQVPGENDEIIDLDAVT